MFESKAAAPENSNGRQIGIGIARVMTAMVWMGLWKGVWTGDVRGAEMVADIERGMSHTCSNQPWHHEMGVLRGKVLQLGV